MRQHQALRATLERSHNPLSDAERAVFRRLAVFAGGLTMETAQSVAGDEQLDEWAVLDHLGTLIDKSLVDDAGDPPRYRLLESTRAFALERLTESGETHSTKRRHAHAVCDLFVRIEEARYGDSGNDRGQMRAASSSIALPLSRAQASRPTAR
jgi:predicted ATPase